MRVTQEEQLRVQPGVSVVEINRWEVDLLRLIEFNITVQLSAYATLCFSLQQRYEEVRSRGA